MIHSHIFNSTLQSVVFIKLANIIFLIPKLASIAKILSNYAMCGQLDTVTTKLKLVP